MTRTTRLLATMLMLAVATYLFSPLSISAGSRAEDTVAPDSFAPDLERAFRQFQARRLPRAQRKAASGPAQINLVFHVQSGAQAEGNVSESVLLAQVSVLNEATGRPVCISTSPKYGAILTLSTSRAAAFRPLSKGSG